MYYRVIPFERTFDTFGLVYKSPLKLGSGQCVKIPFGNTQILGLIYSETSVENLDYDINSIKEISEVISETSLLSYNDLSVVDFIAKHYITPIHNALLLYFPRNLVEKLKKNTFQKITAKNYSYNTIVDIELSGKQEEVYQKIQANAQKLWKFLLYWVTGSGKTEIYIKLIEQNLKAWKQSLLLIPEIILTSQIGERIREVFWQDVLELHSGVSAAKKSQYWVDIKSWNAKIIIGTRSSLFYPYKNLWSIIMDEEHDVSYISDNAPRYHTLEVAEYISQLSKITLLLWSWTPRVTTIYRWLQWELEVLQLLEKYK